MCMLNTHGYTKLMQGTQLTLKKFNIHKINSLINEYIHWNGAKCISEPNGKSKNCNGDWNKPAMEIGA